MRHPWSIAHRIAAAHLLAVGLIAVFTCWASYLQAREVAVRVEEAHVAGVVALMAQEAEVVAALTEPRGAERLQARIPHWTDSAGVEWMSVMDAEGVRVVSWDPGQVGVTYPRPLDRARAGESWTEVSATGSAGRSVRALAPVLRPGSGDVVGVVTMGVPVERTEVAAAAQLPRMAITFSLVALAGVLMAWLLDRYLARVTFGRGPEEIAEQLLLGDAAMDAVDVGIVVLSPDGRVRLLNDAASRLLEAGADRLPPELTAVLDAPDGEDALVSVGDRVLVVRRHRVPAADRNRSGGLVSASDLAAAALEGIAPAPTGTTVLTLHDRTDVQRLGDELSVAHTLTSALRAQTHEHANQLHTALSLLESGRDEAAKGVLARHVRPDDGDGGGILGALLEAKTAQARERGVALTARTQVTARVPLDPLDALTVVGSLVDNAVDAAAEADPDGRWVDAEVTVDDDGLLVQVADGGAGPDAAALERMFERGWTTKRAGADGRGMGLWLVRRIVAAADGTVEAATDSGTVFTAEVPARGDGHAGRAPEDDPRGSGEEAGLHG